MSKKIKENNKQQTFLNKEQEQGQTLTTFEAKKIYKQKEEELEEAKINYYSALERERNYELLLEKIAKRDKKIAELEDEIVMIKSQPAYENYSFLKHWEEKMRDHLNGFEIINEEEFDILYNEILDKL